MKGRTEAICEYVRRMEPGKPIYIGDVAKHLGAACGIPEDNAKESASVICGRILRSKALPDFRRYKKGIYYMTKDTPFGEVPIDRGQLAYDKYIAGGNGYVVGQTLVHELGLTTWVPAERVIATNNAHGGTRRDKELSVTVTSGRTRITNGNIMYLKVLDVLEAWETLPIDAREPEKILLRLIHANNLSFETLLAMGDSFYKKDAVLTLARVVKTALA